MKTSPSSSSSSSSSLLILSSFTRSPCLLSPPPSPPPNSFSLYALAQIFYILGQEMSRLSALLQETARTEAEVSTILGLLRDHVEDLHGSRGRTLSLKERLGFRGVFGCCGAAWGFRPSDHNQQHLESAAAADPDPNPSPSGMNLAAALAAERQLREGNLEAGARGGGGETPVRVSLMRLLEETEEREREGVAGSDAVCCVCMVRKKGAAFIPCGHTYCRVCSREVWLNRGNCPLCNRSILDILDLF